MVIQIIYGVIGAISLFLLGNPKTFISLFDNIFNTKTILDNQVMLSINISFVILIFLLVIRYLIKIKFNLKKTNINYRFILFFILNTLIVIVLKRQVVSVVTIRHIIIEFILSFIILLMIKKIKTDTNPDSNYYLLVLIITIFITTYLKINSILILYLIGRVFRIKPDLNIKYILIYIFSFSLSFILINISNINMFYITTIIGSIITSIYLYFVYYKFNYNKLAWYYLLLVIILLYYFR